jgi:hypothetical protein
LGAQVLMRAGRSLFVFLEQKNERRDVLDVME